MSILQVAIVVAVGWFMSVVVRAVAEEMWYRDTH